MKTDYPAKVKAILIDPVKKTVSNLELLKQGNQNDDDGCAKDIANAIGCELFDTFRIAKDTMIFVDDEGLLKDGLKRFMVKSYGNPLAGKGVVVGIDKIGDTVDVPLTVPEVYELVRWL